MCDRSFPSTCPVSTAQHMQLEFEAPIWVDSFVPCLQPSFPPSSTAPVCHCGAAVDRHMARPLRLHWLLATSARQSLRIRVIRNNRHHATRFFLGGRGRLRMAPSESNVRTSRDKGCERVGYGEVLERANMQGPSKRTHCCCQRFCVGCHLNSSISLMTTRRRSADTHTHEGRRRRGSWDPDWSAYLPNFVAKTTQTPPRRPGRRSCPKLAPDIRNGFCYSAMASTAGFKPQAGLTTR